MLSYMLHFLPFAILNTERILKIIVLQQMSISEHCVSLKVLETDMFL